MLLQTFVQLNILLLTAPALAGWTLLPAAHPILAQAAQVVFQPAVRQAEGSPQAVAERRAAYPSSQRSTVARPEVMVPPSPAMSSSPSAVMPVEPIVTQFNPFPQAARAP